MPFASYACLPGESRGRRYPEPPCALRSPFQRDRDRILHAAAFRRLEYKTQVFVNHEGDHYRTRLTHSLEVAQLARSVARSLALNEDLAEALALAHDLGHPPFGHAGEDALKLAMKEFGGFDHNAQTLRILTKLEHRYAEFDGLNLTWEMLEGVAKHNGPLKSVPTALAEYNREHDLELSTYASLEAQVASLSDDIAYNNHDMDDGIRAGFFTLEELAAIPVVGEAAGEVKAKYGDLPEGRRRHETIRRVIHKMVMDLTRTIEKNLEQAKIRHVNDIRALGKPIAEFSAPMQESQKLLKQFLMSRMYRHYKINRMSSKARRVVVELFGFFHSEPECLPDEWRSLAGKPASAETAGVVKDFIAGMTDRFALQEHQRVFNLWRQEA